MANTVSGGGTLIDKVALAPAIDRCLGGWGPDLLGYLLGAGLDGHLAAWRLMDALQDPKMVERLAALDDLLQLFKESRVARAWIRSISPELGRDSPARAIRHGNGHAVQRVRELAEGFTAKL